MTKLGDICKFQSGGTPSKKNSSYFGGMIPWITTVSLNGSVIGAESAVDWITDKAICESAAKIVPSNSIMVGTRVGVGKVAINSIPMSTSQDIISLLDIDESSWDKNYLCKFILSKNDYLNSQARGATIKGIKIDVLSQLELSYIDIEKQKEIAHSIDNIEHIISLRKKQLQKLDDLIKSRFVEMFGDPIYNTKRLKTNPLKDVLSLKAGDFTAASDITDVPTETNKYPCYGGNGIRGYVADYNQEGEYSLVGRQGALSGNVQFASGRFKNTEHALLVTSVVTMNSIWLNQLLLILDLKRYQTGAAQPGLSVKNLQEIQIITVSIDEQDRFARFVEQTEKTKAIIQKGYDKLEQMKQAMMQKYFG